MRYSAFLLDSDLADSRLASVLPPILEKFNKPWYRRRACRIFRDETGLVDSPNLTPEVERALLESEYLLVLASLRAADSPKVRRVIGYWLATRSAEEIVIALTDGECVWDNAAGDYDWMRTTALPNALRGVFRTEAWCIDLRWTQDTNLLSLNNPRYKAAITELHYRLRERKSYLVTHRDLDQKMAIVFVHGYAGDPTTTWGSFPDCLVNDGRTQGSDIFSIGYSSGFGLDIVGLWKADPDIPLVAGLLRTALGLPPFDRYKKLTLVAHSMGGLAVQRAVVDDDELARRVSYIVLFGTPSRGLIKAALFSFWKRQFRNLSRWGSFIRDLRKRWTKKYANNVPFGFLAVAGTTDQFVGNSALAPFPVDQTRVVEGDHLSIVKPSSCRNLSVELVIKAVIGGDLLIEMDTFKRDIKNLESTENLDEKGLVRLALALDREGRQEDAIRLLESRIQPGYTDAMGVLAGRLKRRWITKRDRKDAIKALDLYTKAYELAIRDIGVNPNAIGQAFYHGINIAFMRLAFSNDRNTAKEMALEVLEHCKKADRDKWSLATEGEAHLVLGAIDKAIESYKEAIRIAPHAEPRERDSMFQQAYQIASIIGDKSIAARLEAVFRGGEL